MAYKTKDLFNKAKEAISTNNLFFVEDVVSFLPCDKTTYYKHKLHENNELKELLETNKVKTKSNLRAKWYKSDNATLQMALYKLLASDAERRNLAMEYKEHGGEIKVKLYEGDKEL